jgi:hypothetical protein
MGKERESKNLVLLDLDGLLFIRIKKREIADKMDEIKSTYNTFEHKVYLYVLRPGYDVFIDYCLENYHVGIFSSITKENISIVVDNVFGSRVDKLKFILDRNLTKLDPDFGNPKYNHLHIKPHDTIKNIYDVISNPIINTNRIYDLYNTIIVDDSFRKLRFNRWDSICVFTPSERLYFEPKSYIPNNKKKYNTNYDSYDEVIKRIDSFFM